MTRKSKRELEHALAQIEGEGHRDDFVVVEIDATGGTRTERTERYRWDDVAGVYRSDEGRERMPGEAPTGFDFAVGWADDS
ncbi:hypothetical protein [Natronorubrum sp. FCH18a]|uniref:hypothetical protein n=1 Tax=Natronorubrum sp. FCH18a TaxID=3447018 RepID=UPI003F5199EA